MLKKEANFDSRPPQLSAKAEAGAVFPVIRKIRPNVLLGVSGGIAAYKAVDLASSLTAAGARVNTIMTENACRFISPKSFEGVTGSAVFTSMWSMPEEYKSGHIALLDWADVIVVAPATANIISKIASGICNDLLSTTLCACWRKPTFLAPAMNNNMWTNPAVQRNVTTIKKMGFKIIGPAEGRLACGTEAVGRMVEPSDILSAIEKITSKINRRERKERRE
jgi:phosphopantothenoylcysteine decarboxylase/phosphopantothenate--cysteine ligase